MSFPLNIQGTIIQFPSSSDSPNWSEALIQFAQAVAGALASVTGPFDISPQIYTMTTAVNSNISLPGLSFPTNDVRGAIIDYVVSETTNINSVAEVGTLYIVYNAAGPTGNKWEISREFTGESPVTFSILDTGQVQFSSTTLAGTGFVGSIGFLAKAVLNA